MDQRSNKDQWYHTDSQLGITLVHLQ